MKSLKTYLHFLKYINLTDIVTICCIYFSFQNRISNNFIINIESIIFIIIAFVTVTISTIYYIRKIKIKRSLYFISTAVFTKFLAYLLFVILFFSTSNLQSTENAVMFLFWLALAYCLLNSYGFLLEDKFYKD